LIDEASEKVARRIIGEIMGRLEEMRDFPEAGSPRFHVRQGLRMVVKHGYAAYYIVTGAEIVVVRVLHGSRDVDAVRAEGGFD